MIVDPSQNPSDDKVEELLESQDLSIFTQDVSIHCLHTLVYLLTEGAIYTGTTCH